MIMGETKCANNTGVFSTNKNIKNKNFKEDDESKQIHWTRLSIGSFSEISDRKSEISEGKRIDIDSDVESQFDYNTKIKDDPKNKHFPFFYEINFYGQYDFIFEFKGDKTKSEFSRLTTKIRQYPHHLKYTLFANDKIKALREKEFIFVFYTFDEIKEKGNKLYKRGKFRDALETYMEAYSLLKWIEFKDKSKNNYFYSKLIREEIPILDDDIVEKNSYDLNLNLDEDSYRFCIVNILLCMSYCYIELRHYSSAIDCLNDCVSYCEDNEKDPDAYLRRSQARMYNKFSDDAQLVLALADIQKAISLSVKSENKIYNDHYNILMKLIQTRKTIEKERIKKFVSDCFNMYIKNQSNMKCILESNLKNIYQHTQYKVLKEMKLKYKLAVKYYNETKNNEQLVFAYKEIENFIEIYHNFKWFYKFGFSKINNYLIKYNHQDPLDLDLEIENLILSENITRIEFINFMERYKYKIADKIFQSGNYNIDLIKYAIEKVVAREKNEFDIYAILKKDQFNYSNTSSRNKYDFSDISLLLSFSLVILSLGLIFAHYYIYMKYPHKFFKEFQR